MNIYDIEKKLLEEQKKEPVHLDAGSAIKIHYKIRDREKERTQPIEGIVIKTQGIGIRKTLTIRRISFGSGMEMTFPLCSPNIEKIEVIKPPKKRARRARLYYLRDRLGKEAVNA